MAEAEQWRAIAGAANSDLGTAALQPLWPHLNDASATLGFRRTQMGVLAAGGVAVVPLQSVDLVGPAEMLANASRELARYNDLQSRVLRAFFYYGRTLGAFAPLPCPLWQSNFHPGPRGDDDVWQNWAERRDDALHRTEQTSQSLRTLAAHDLATVDAFAVARSFPENSPSFVAWMLAAENLAVRAVEEASAVLQSELAIFNAVTLQYIAGFGICNNR